MKESIAINETKGKVFVGLDVHLLTYAVCVLEEGKAIKRWTMPAEPKELSSKLKKEYPDSEIYSVYEAGFSGFVLHRELEASGIRNIVVNVASIPVRISDRIKTDRRDAKKLSEQLMAGMLNGVRIPSIEEELRRQLSRFRQQLMRDRTRIMVQIRRRLYHFGYLTHYRGILRRCDIKELLSTLPDSELKTVVSIHLRIWENLEKEISVINKELKKQAENCPLELLYRQVPGIGQVVSRILANELGDLKQFKNEKSLFRFVGLTPSERSSGEKTRRGGITRQGSALLRKVLVEAAWAAIRKDSGLKKFYSRLSARAGATKAIVAVARKLIGRARAVIRKGEAYREEVLIAA